MESLRLKAFAQNASSLTLRELAEMLICGNAKIPPDELAVYKASQILSSECSRGERSRLHPVASLAYFAMSKLHLSYSETMDGIPAAVLFQMIGAFNEENGIDFRFSGEPTEKERRMNEALSLLNKNKSS